MNDHEAYLAWWNNKGVTQPRVTAEQHWHAGIAHEREKWESGKVFKSLHKRIAAVDKPCPDAHEGLHRDWTAVAGE